MNISENGIKFIHSFEGCRLTAYKAVPTEKYWTIGWGHYGPDVKKGMKISQKKADDMFKKDIQAYVNHVKALNMNLNQNEFDALVSFCYNCGAGNLNQLCSDRNKNSIRKWLPAYNKSGGVVLTGLTRRRNAELALFNTPVKGSVNVSNEKDEYFTKAPKKVASKTEIGVYKDVELKHLVVRYNKGTPFTIVGLEKSKAGTPRLKTKSGYYVSGNKKYFRKI